MAHYFEYGPEATEWLAARSPRMGEVITLVGRVRREMDTDLFSAVVHHIVGQQVSMAAQRTVWARMREHLGEVTPASVNAAAEDELQACGMTHRKASYIKDFARRAADGTFDLAAIEAMDDAQAICALSSLRGVGTWTAEMLLLFCLGRPDVLSFDDLAIQRGLRMVYHHRRVPRPLFERYRRLFSPWGSVASLYLWAVATSSVPGFERDYAPMTEAQKKARGAARRKERAGS